jgi:hypothetical protein
MTQPRNLSIFADGLNSSGVAAPSVGGTGTGTSFTTGSVVFAGASGVYNQSNANFFWDNSNIRLGIGTSSPQILLHSYSGLAGNNNNTYTTQIRAENNGTAGISIASPTANQGVISYATPLDNCSGAIVMDGTNRYMAFCTVNATERMRIDSSGNLIVNATSTLAGGKVNVVGNSNVIASQCANGNATFLATNTSGTASYNALVCYNNGTSYSYCGGISVSGSSTAFNTSSDYRLKENIRPMIGGLSTIQNLNPVVYDWINTKIPGEGFIAHELQKFIPAAVTGEKDAVDIEGNPVYQSVDYSKIVVHLVAAIQEQQKQIASLLENVSVQASEIDDLKNRQA